MEIVDSDEGFWILENGRAWFGGWDSLSLGDALQALQASVDDDSTPFDGAIIPRRAETIRRMRGAKVVAISA